MISIYLADKKGTSTNNDIRKFFGGFKGDGKSLTNSSNEKKTSKKSKSEGNPPLKENIPSYSGNKKLSGNSANNVNNGNSSSNKTNNVHGFGSTATGTVKHVNINNASRSKVHGFTGGTGSPAKKKPRLGSEGSGSSTTGGKQSGNSVGGAGLAARTGVGSKTVTVKGKTQTSRSENDNGNSTTTNPTFVGQGNSLGGHGSGMSRLLNLYSSSSGTSNKTSRQEKPSSVKSETSDSASQKLMASCHICNNDFPKCIIDKHISDCIGEFDDEDDDWEESCPVQTNTTNEKVQEADSISISSDDTEDITVSNNPCPSDSLPNMEPVETISDEETYPCPVCSERFSQSRINEHLDTHFQ